MPETPENKKRTRNPAPKRKSQPKKEGRAITSADNSQPKGSISSDSRRSKWLAVILVPALSILCWVACGVGQGLGLSLFEPTASNQQSNTTIRDNKGLVVAGVGNTVSDSESGSVDDTSEPSFDPTSLTLPDSDVEIQNNTGAVIYGIDNKVEVLFPASSFEAKKRELELDWSMTRKRVSELPSQPAKKILLTRMTSLESGITSPADEDGIERARAELNIVKSRVAVLRGDFSEARQLLSPLSTVESQILRFQLAFKQGKLAEAVSIANSLPTDDLLSRQAKARAFLLAWELGKAESMKTVAATIVECEEISRLLRNSQTPENLLAHIDLCNDELIHINIWLDLAAKHPNDVSRETINSMAGLADLIGPRTEESYRQLAVSGFEDLSRNRIGDTLRQSSCHQSIWYLMTKFVGPKDGDLVFRRLAVSSSDGNALEAIHNRISVLGNAAILEFAGPMFEIAARAFERGELSVAIRQMDALLKQVKGLAIAADTYTKIVVSHAGFHLNEFNGQDDAQKSGLSQLAFDWAVTVHRHRQVRRFDVFLPDAARALAYCAQHTSDTDHRAVCQALSQEIVNATNLVQIKTDNN